MFPTSRTRNTRACSSCGYWICGGFVRAPNGISRRWQHPVRDSNTTTRYENMEGQQYIWWCIFTVRFLHGFLLMVRVARVCDYANFRARCKATRLFNLWTMNACILSSVPSLITASAEAPVSQPVHTVTSKNALSAPSHLRICFGFCSRARVDRFGARHCG